MTVIRSVGQPLPLIRVKLASGGVFVLGLTKLVVEGCKGATFGRNLNSGTSSFL